MLYEHFNTTNQTSPHFERHENFVTDIKLPSCGMVQAMPYKERCDYVSRTEECQDNIFILDYVYILYCQISPESKTAMAFGVVLLICICGYLFILLAATSDKFFCPSLTVLSRMMGLNENVAGVTLVAFGNGAPDLFTSLAGLSGESRRLYSDLNGGTIFVVLVVAGSVVINKPFALQPATFLRDVLFLLLDVIYIGYIIKRNNSVSIIEASCTLLIYVFYIIVVLVDQYLVKKMTSTLEKSKRSHQLSDFDMAALRDLHSEAILMYPPRTLLSEAELSVVTATPRNHNLFKQFILSLRPFTAEEWANSRWFMRIYSIISAPAYIYLNFVIPLVDVDAENEGWSKLLNCLQLTILPTLISYTVFRQRSLASIPIYAYILVITAPLAILVFCLTRTAIMPHYHKYYAILGAIGSVFMVYACAAEVVSILDVLGITTYRSNSFIGCTLLAWGNSIGDLMANLALARQGYEKMGFAACYGGPLFNTLMAIGSASLYKSVTSPSHSYQLAAGTMGENCMTFLTIGLFGILFGGIATNFSMRRSIGVFTVLLYILYLSYNVMGEVQFIHTYGSDHRLDLQVGWLDFV